MNIILRNRYLYLINFALLVTHQIEAAYWQEWKLFGIPGGIQVFMVLNFLLILLGLWGMHMVMKRIREGLYFALGLAAAGVFAGLFHTYFLMAGRPEFSLPLSMILLGLIFLVSLVQAGKAVDSLWITRGEKLEKAEHSTAANTGA